MFKDFNSGIAECLGVVLATCMDEVIMKAMHYRTGMAGLLESADIALSCTFVLT
jgi:hypothetical protein